MVRKRKIIVYIATSADGFIARTDGSVDWLDRPRPKGNYGMGVFYKSIDTILLGRKTCDMALDFQGAKASTTKRATGCEERTSVTATAICTTWCAVRHKEQS